MSGKQINDSEVELNPRNVAERRTLILVLVINFAQVVVAGTVGFAADSTGLLGSALDNLADAGVYAVSLYAVGRTVVAQSRAASLSGVLLILLALGLFGEVVRRFLAGAEPIGLAMIIVAAASAATNIVNLRLLRKHREDGVHLKASWIFTTNDMLANAGIAVSGVAVMILNSPLPDFLIGLLISAIVLKGGWDILREARLARRFGGVG